MYFQVILEVQRNSLFLRDVQVIFEVDCQVEKDFPPSRLFLGFCLDYLKFKLAWFFEELALGIWTVKNVEK